MPTILRIDGFRFYFYSHEPNEPPHVHIDNARRPVRWPKHFDTTRLVSSSCESDACGTPELGDCRRWFRNSLARPR